jgi:hypothetical protein
LLLKFPKDVESGHTSSILHRQRLLTQRWEGQRFKNIIQLSTRFEGARAVKDHCCEALAEFKLA